MTTAPAIAAPPRFFVVIAGVAEADGVHSDMVDEAKKIFADEIAKHGELTLVPPAEIGTLADVDTMRAKDPDAFKSALRAHHLRALELTLRVLDVNGSLSPPPEGKPFRVLKRGVKLAVIGDALPDKIIAIGGDGESTIASEIRKNENEEVEGKKLLAEAMKTAVAQAVDMTVTKLNLPPPKDESKKKKRAK